MWMPESPIGSRSAGGSSQPSALCSRLGGTAERTIYEGVGEGGDNTLALDRRCEDLVFAELEARESGLSLTAVSEERGQVHLATGTAQPS